MHRFRTTFAAALICATFALSTVLAEDDVAPKINVELLTKAWTHSREEDKTEKGKVFRPAGSKKFPPSRFRQRYVFSKDGTCEALYLDPADGHHMVSGKWTIDEKNPRVIVLDCKKIGKRTLKVLKLTDKILLVK